MTCIKKKRKILQRAWLLAVCLWAAGLSASAQNVALKTNLLYWATTTPNLGAEVSFARKHSVQLFYGLNPWRASGSRKSIRHWLVQPEVLREFQRLVPWRPPDGRRVQRR